MSKEIDMPDPERRLALAAKARFAQTRPSDVPSPCTAVCRIDTGSGRCEGCLRTLDEIAAWSRLNDAGKRAVWRNIGLRARHGEPP